MIGAAVTVAEGITAALLGCSVLGAARLLRAALGRFSGPVFCGCGWALRADRDRCPGCGS